MKFILRLSICRLLLMPLIAAMLAISVSARADLQGELSVYYGSDSLATATTDSAARSYYALDLYVAFDNKNKWFFGFHVDQISHVQTIDQTVGTFTALDMGPTLGYVFDEKGTYDLQLGYLVSAKSTYQVTGSEAEKWDGTALFASIGILPEIKDDLRLGIRINYYASTITQSTVGTTAAEVAYTKNWIFPSIVLSYRK